MKEGRALGLRRDECREVADRWCGPASISPVQESMAWNSLFITGVSPETPDFRTHGALLARARNYYGRRGGNRVTDFSGWVFKLCFQKSYQNRHALDAGKQLERKLLSADRARSKVQLPVPKVQGKGWRLLFRDPLTRVDPFPISKLGINGCPLFGIPDIVYENTKTGEVLIVEIKASDRDIPTDGWPNLRAQLWCYGQIDRWVDAPKVTLVSQVWTQLGGKLSLRKTLRWDREDERLNRECEALLDCYRQLPD